VWLAVHQGSSLILTPKAAYPVDTIQVTFALRVHTIRASVELQTAPVKNVTEANTVKQQGFLLLQVSEKKVISVQQNLSTMPTMITSLAV